MDSILTFALIPYRLVLQREPFTLIIERGAQRPLQTMPHAEPSTDWQVHEQEVRVTFPDSTLSITIADMAIHLHWQSAHRQRLAFTNYGYWYGQGGLIHQRWPLDRVMQSMTELLTCDNGPTGLLCIQTPAWLSSNGCVVMTHSPVRFASNQSLQESSTFAWDLGASQAPFDQRPALDPGDLGDGLLTLDGCDLRVDISLAADLPAGYQQLVSRLGHPHRLPPVGLFSLTGWRQRKQYASSSPIDLPTFW